ncbi:ArsR family transcriptional regulator [Streptomyces sp. 8K308]|uniref:winged helix-turn-helix domain-containing protein n=1 Tax=Streptomyces sp. 8K308 TaxID=2530388 RepID=UPI00105311AC|nr:helix-turn-helix domain-containing protein [Streptomyces sp. 8K308]TDC15182.1 ArsR family transcriptional regulator [Streptomyces sp. 8K308]
MTEPGKVPPAERVVLDGRGLRALAHPVRVRLVGLLRQHGPATATQLARRLSLNSGATSYHLRQLAAAGFVEEDTERGNARDRWWRAVHQLTAVEPELVEAEPEAAQVFLQSVAAAHTLRLQQGLNELATMPRDWGPAFYLSDVTLRLTPEQARELGRELWAVLERYREENRQRADDEGRESVAVQFHVLPEVGDDEERAT